MAETQPMLPRPHESLSARLLVMTVVFVMLAELFIYTPSVARFRKVYLEERLERAYLATLAVEAMPEQIQNMDLDMILLDNTGNHAIVLRKPDRRLLIAGDMPPRVDATFDLRANTAFGWVGDAFAALAQADNRVLRVLGDAPSRPGVEVEVLMDETPMRQEMYEFSKRIFQLSLVISLFTAGLVYVSLQWLIVRPMRRVTAAMEAFRRAPEDETRLFRPSDRSDEIGIAQRELAVMQQELRLALRQKDRLAMLGAAVTKVNHDLRNTLATAMLVGDRLATIDDPEVQRLVPRMFRAMDRAVNLCGQTLDYASATMPMLDLKPTELKGAIDLVGETLGQEAQANGEGAFMLDNAVPPGLVLLTDLTQLLRVFENLGRNAVQAGARRVRVAAHRDGPAIFVEVADDGPGLPSPALERLFQPFTGSARAGGTGLGLVIAREIVHAHGGEIELAKTGPEGTLFRLRFPPPPEAAPAQPA